MSTIQSSHRIERALALMPTGSVVTDQAIIASHTLDYRRQYQGAAAAMLRPANVQEVQQIVRVCSEFSIPLVPQGGNTGYCAGATPNADGSELILSLDRMTRIREIDPGNASMTADAGAILYDLQQAASEREMLLPLGLGSQASCRIGGNVSTNAGGISVLRYGMARNILLGLEVVLPNGELLSDLAPLRKDNSGYDVKQLFVGAEGTLGIVTGVSLALARKPRQRVTALLSLERLDVLSDLLAKAQVHTGEQITSFEYVSRQSLDLLLASHPDLRHPLPGDAQHYVLLEAATVSPMIPLEDIVSGFLTEVMEAGDVTDGTLATNERQREELWHLRESLPDGEVRHGGSIKHDVAVRTSRIADFIAAASAIVKKSQPELVLSIYGHVGDGNVHFNVVCPRGLNEKAWVEAVLSPEIHALAKSVSGTFSAEYGIGRVKLGLLREYADPAKIDIMRRIKAALDPQGILNPGKVIPA